MRKKEKLSSASLCCPGMWLYALGLYLAAAVGSLAQGTDVCRAAEPDVLVLEASVPQWGQVEGETDELMGDLLLRELARQAVLIAARDELGLATRDAALREPIPEGIDNDAILEIDTIARTRRGIQITISQQGDVLFDHEERVNIGPVNMYIAVIEQMEQLSRGALREAISETGLQCIPPAGNKEDASDGAVSAEIETLLSKMDILSQYEAARLCHEQIRAAGESPERLGALVRAYSHLGQLTQPFLSSMHRSFRARSLLYAQRLIAADPESPWGYWHRAYALSLAGIQRWSYSDLGRAQQKIDAGRNEMETPAWVVLLDQYNHYDYKALSEAGHGDDGQSQLAGLLWFASVETSPCTPLVIETGKTVLQNNPYDLRVIDGLINQAGVSMQHSLTVLGPQQLGALLASKLADLPSVPEDIRSVYGRAENTDLASPLYRGELAEALVQEAEDDRGEPSIAVLGRLVEEQNVLHIYRRASFLRDWLSVDSSDLIKQMQPALRHHPYGPLVSSVSFERRASPDEYQNTVGGMAIGDLNIASMLRLLNRVPERVQFANMSQREAWSDLFQQRSPLEFEYYKNMLWRNTHDRVLFANWMADVSQHSPYRYYVLITDDWEASQENLPNWEREYGDHPLIALAFAEKFTELEETEKAIDYYHRFLAEVPSTDAAVALARLLYQDGNEDWLETLETALEYDDYGLDHARVNCHIADTLMQEDNYNDALPYARSAASSGSAWGMTCLAFCKEGLGEHDEADALMQAVTDRYGHGEMYFWDVRTGRGKLEDDWLAYQRVLYSWYSPQDDIHTVAEFRYLLYSGEKNDALEFAHSHRDRIAGPLDQLAIALLAEEQGDEDFYREVLDEIVEDEQSATQTGDDVMPLGQFLKEVDALPSLDKDSVEALLDSHSEVGTGSVLVYLGWHLANEGETDLATHYLSQISGSRRWGNNDILFGQVKLRELGVDLGDVPRRYPYGFDRD